MGNTLVRLKEISDFIVKLPYVVAGFPHTTRILSTVDITYTDSNNTQTEHPPEKQVVYNQRGRHAEVNFIDCLDEKIKSLDEKNYKNLKVEAKLVQNYSPC